MESTMKLKNLYFGILAAYALGGTNAAHGSQRFINLARYATAMAARCSQAFQTVKEHKPVKWIMDHKVAVARAGITAGLVANEAFELTDLTAKNIVLEALIKRKINALFASQGITIKINNLSPNYRKSNYVDFLAEVTKFEKEEKITIDTLLLFFVNHSTMFCATDRNMIALTCLNSYKFIDEEFIIDLFRMLSNNQDKINFTKQLIQNRQFKKSLTVICIIFSDFSSKIRSELALLFLEENFDTLDEYCNYFLINELFDTAKKKYYMQKLIETKNIEKLAPQQINVLFLNFSEKEASDLASLFLKRSFNTLLESPDLHALPTIMSHLSSETERVDYLYQAIESKKIKSFNDYKIFIMLNRLSAKVQAQWALLLLEESYGDDPENTNYSFMSLIQYCPEGLQDFWLEELIKKNKILRSFISELAQGPFFSFEFIRKHHPEIRCVLRDKCNNVYKEKEAETITKNASSFAEKEYAKGNIVLFHGQHDQWAFFEKTFKALLKIKYNKITPENFTWLRFTEQALLSDTEVAEIQKDGVTRETYTHYRPKVLFTNLHLLANYEGSNSLHYVLSNSDQTTLHNKFDLTIIKNQFVELGMEKEYEQLQQEDPLLFKKLYDLYKKEVLARSNIGRLVGISLPKDLASKLCYATTSGAYLIPHSINGEQTTDITRIAEFYDQVGFYNEHALLLSDLFTNPEKATAAGIIMETFSSKPTEESKKYAAELETEFAKTMNHVDQVHKKCMSSTEQK